MCFNHPIDAWFKTSFNVDKMNKYLKIMKSMISVYNSGKYDYNYILSLDLKDIETRNFLYCLYSYLFFKFPTDQAINYIENNKNIINILKKEKNSYDNEFQKCYKLSSDFYNNALLNKFINYPYNLIKEEKRKKVFEILYGDFVII